VKGSYLEPVANRTVVGIALNILAGAMLIVRAQSLKHAGVSLAPAACAWQPIPPEDIYLTGQPETHVPAGMLADFAAIKMGNTLV
jgi:hypothetical protein